MLRIPITMCHGLPDRETDEFPLTYDRFDKLIGIASELGFESIDYDDLAAWREGTGELPERPIMFDIDHPMLTVRNGVQEIFAKYGYHGSLFINTGVMHEDADGWSAKVRDAGVMTWQQIGELVELGWHIGAHTVTHPDLSKLLADDPDGEQLQKELEDCDAEIEKELGIKPKDFAFTGISWSSVAEKLVMKRYRFGRLWIIRSTYHADGEKIRYADLVNVEGEDEADGGPPMAARYITKDMHAYRLPSMEFQSKLMNKPEQFRSYLEGALA